MLDISEEESTAFERSEQRRSTLVKNEQRRTSQYLLQVQQQRRESIPYGRSRSKSPLPQKRNSLVANSQQLRMSSEDLIDPTLKAKVDKRRKSSIFSFTQAMRKVSSSVTPSRLYELKGFDKLATLDSISIELADWHGVQNAINCYAISGISDFHDIPFYIKDQTHGNGVIYFADLSTQEGFVVKEPGTKDNLMSLKFAREMNAEEEETCVARLRHPAGLEIMRLNQMNSDDDAIKLVQVSGGQNTVVGYAKEELRCLLLLARCFKMTFDASNYKVQKGPCYIADITPTCTAKSNIYAVHFDPGVRDSQTRAGVLGLALFLTVQIAYPQLCHMVEENVRKKKSRS